MVTIVQADTPDKIPLAPVEGKVTVVYWDICGLVQPIRLALALSGVDFVDVRVDCGTPNTPEYKKMWMDFKPQLDAVLDFPNLPYLLDGEVALSQSNAILRYLGRKHGLMGDPGSTHLVDLVLDQMADFDQQVTGRCYRDFGSLRPYCEQQLPGILERWARLLGAKSFLAGGLNGPSSDTLTVADLKFYEVTSADASNRAHKRVHKHEPHHVTSSALALLPTDAAQAATHRGGEADRHRGAAGLPDALGLPRAHRGRSRAEGVHGERRVHGAAAEQRPRDVQMRGMPIAVAEAQLECPQFART